MAKGLQNLPTFVREYVRNGRNATKAAIAAGYGEKYAAKAGSRLMARPEVRDAIEVQLEKAMRGLDISVERVLRERARLAFFDPRKFYDQAGRLKAVHELDDDTAAVLQGLEVDEISVEGAAIGTTKKVKFADKDKALTALEKHLGMYKQPEEEKPAALNIFINLA